MKTYQATVIFPSTMKEDAVEKGIEKIRGDIAKLEGIVADVQNLGSRFFARKMQKKEAGIYVRFIFSMAADKLATLQGRCKLNEDIFRMQIVTA